MSDPHLQDSQDEDDSDKSVTFDMYHFFSRKDVLLAGLLILALLLYVVFRFLSGASAV